MWSKYKLISIVNKSLDQFTCENDGNSSMESQVSFMPDQSRSLMDSQKYLIVRFTGKEKITANP